jgi:acetamidase/formamidase
MALHHLEPERATLHGRFSRELPAALTIDPGDTVVLRTLQAGWWLGPQPDDFPKTRSPKFEPRDPARDNGHALCGPIAIRGAEPGMALGVRIDDLRPGTWGMTFAGGFSSAVNDRLGVTDSDVTALRWELDPGGLTGRDQYGHQLSLRPFMGVMGLPPDEPDWHSTSPPRPCGGNIDCKELVPGSTLYLPVTVPGALFSVGDGHALQGDGEVSETAIECPMDRVELTFTLHPDLHLKTPRAETPIGWLTFGFHTDLDEAMLTALEAMIELIEQRHHLPRGQALALASLVVDLRITQVVNGVLGVHAVLPHGAL